MDTSDIDAQIAALEELKAERLAAAEAQAARDARERAKVLVGSTPTKPRPKPAKAPSPPKQPAFRAPRPGGSSANRSFKAPGPAPGPAPLPAPSSLAARFASRRAAVPRTELPSLVRSTGFGERADNDSGSSQGKGKAKANDDGSDDELVIVRTGAERASDLTVLDNLPLGPGEFGLDPEGENEWRALEPNSGIRLSKRVLPHDEVQDLLYGRYHLRPPQVYSVARLSRDGSTYDIPVDGDWITIAVVAERGEVRVSGMRDAVSNDEDEEDEDDDNDGQPPGAKAKSAKGKGKDGKDPKKRKRRPKKYLSLKLVALPPRSKSLGSAAASGDAMLTLLLFESDATIRSPDGEVRTYRGGSGGAYERWCNLAVGSVIALLNPRVLRPLKSGAGAPHPLTHPLALNPQSDASIQLIGHATDLGQCVSTLRDGSRCKTWVDTRLNTVCEYHLHAAVVRGRSSRAEFASASTPLGFGGAVGGSGGAGSGSGYDPRTKTGLLPRNGARPAPADGGGATYIVGTGIAHTGLQPPGSAGGAFLSERMGRGQAAKRKRQEAKEAEAALAKILEHGGDNSVGAKYLSSLGVALGKDKDKDPKEGEPERKRVFTAEAIKRIGYDPSGRRNEDPSKRNATIAALMAPSTRPVQLGRPLGPKKLSNVVTPAAPGPKRNKDDLVELD